MPEDKFLADLTKAEVVKFIEQREKGADAIGEDPETGLKVYVLSGRYGPYVQLGENETEDGGKPKRVSIPPSIGVDNVDIKMALKLLSLPIFLGTHPETGKDVKKGLGRFGPYILHNSEFRSIPVAYNLFDVDMETALYIMAQPKKGRGAKALRELGDHPETGDKVSIFDGKYGPYAKCGKVNASLSEDADPEKVTLEEAVELLAPKMAAKGKKKKVSAKKKTSSAKKKVSAVTTKTVAKKKVIRRKAPAS